MREMKDSRIEWIGEIPADWNVKKLKYTFAISSGTTPKSDNLEYWDGDIPWVTPADYKTEDKYVYHGRKFLSEAGLNAANLQLLPVNSIIFSKRAPIGVVAITGAKLAINQGCISCVPAIECDIRYYYFILSIYTEQFNLLGAGTTFKEISSKDFGNFTVPAPSISVQEKLADYLDRKCSQIDAIISRQQEVIEKLKSYKLSIITEAVTKGLNPNVPMKDSGVEWIGKIPSNWTKVKLKNICHFINGDRSSNYPSPNEYVDDGIPFLGADSLCGRYVDITQSKKITKEKYQSMGGAKIQEGDILYTLRGSTIGKNAMATFDEGTVASSLMVIRPISLISAYLLYWLNSEEEFQQRQSYINGSTAPNLSAENVGSFVMFLPSVAEQREISEYLDKKCAEIESIILKKQILTDQLSDYKKSLIYEVVT